MPFKIIRNDITKMNTEAIVNTANDHAAVGTGCDSAVYEAAGYQELLEYRKKHIGFVEEGGAFITPGFQLQFKAPRAFLVNDDIFRIFPPGTFQLIRFLRFFTK